MADEVIQALAKALSQYMPALGQKAAGTPSSFSLYAQGGLF